jgi:hypothetical protein
VIVAPVGEPTRKLALVGETVESVLLTCVTSRVTFGVRSVLPA